MNFHNGKALNALERSGRINGFYRKRVQAMGVYGENADGMLNVRTFNICRLLPSTLLPLQYLRDSPSIFRQQVSSTANPNPIPHLIPSSTSSMKIQSPVHVYKQLFLLFQLIKPNIKITAEKNYAVLVSLRHTIRHYSILGRIVGMGWEFELEPKDYGENEMEVE